MLDPAIKEYLSSFKDKIPPSNEHAFLHTSYPVLYTIDDDNYASALGDMKMLDVQFVRTSSFCRHVDGLPDIDKLLDSLIISDVDYRDNRKVIIGLGEYLLLRGQDYAKRVLSKLKDIRTGNTKAVILLRGVSGFVSEMVMTDPRLKNKFIVSETNYFSLSLTNIQYDTDSVATVDFMNVLAKIEDGYTGDLVCRTDLDFPNSCIPIRKITRAYQIIKFRSVDFPIREEFGTESQWQMFLEKYEAVGHDPEAVFAEYGFDSAYDEDLYHKLTTDEFRCWLYFISLKFYEDQIPNSYLRYVVANTDHFDELKINVLNAIIDFKHIDDRFAVFYSERKKLARDYPDSDIAGFVHENECDESESIYHLTDNTLVEKQAIITWVSKHGEIPELENIYPDLSAYLNKYVFDSVPHSKELTDYFDQYKHQKVDNKITDSFYSLVLTYAKNLLYGQLQTRDNAVIQIGDKEHTKLCWIDALGVEYLSYITYLARKKGLRIESCQVSRADLPTFTTINEQFFNDWDEKKRIKIPELDEVKHKDKGGYDYEKVEYPIHLARELEIISDAIDRAATDLATHKCKKFVIASDHGASRLAVIKNFEEKYNSDEPGKHSGRCCKLFEGYDIPYALEDNGYIVLSDYGRLRFSRKANVEVHGGATLEEVIVPVISFTLSKQSVTVMLIDKDISSDMKGTIIKISVSSADEQVSIIINGCKYQGQSEDGHHFVFNLTGIKRPREYSAEVYDGDNLIGTIKFKSHGRLTKGNSDFDDLT